MADKSCVPRQMGIGDRVELGGYDVAGVTNVAETPPKRRLATGEPELRESMRLR